MPDDPDLVTAAVDIPFSIIYHPFLQLTSHGFVQIWSLFFIFPSFLTTQFPNHTPLIVYDGQTTRVAHHLLSRVKNSEKSPIDSPTCQSERFGFCVPARVYPIHETMLPHPQYNPSYMMPYSISFSRIFTIFRHFWAPSQPRV